jgi:hypothetical protein
MRDQTMAFSGLDEWIEAAYAILDSYKTSSIFVADASDGEFERTFLGQAIDVLPYLNYAQVVSFEGDSDHFIFYVQNMDKVCLSESSIIGDPDIAALLN